VYSCFSLSLSLHFAYLTIFIGCVSLFDLDHAHNYLQNLPRLLITPVPGILTHTLKLTCIDIRINTLCVGCKLLFEISFYNAVPPSQQYPEEAITIAKKKKIVRVHTISRLNEINLNLMYDRQLSFYLLTDSTRMTQFCRICTYV
jgi:hypothetical protein